MRDCRIEIQFERDKLSCLNRRMVSQAVPVPVGPVLVTTVYFLVYFAFHMRVLRTKRSLRREYRTRGEEFDRYYTQDRRMLTADRCVLNMLEHMPPFLCLLWLHAVFVSSLSATVAGSAYVVTRAAYPFLLGPVVGTRLPRRLLAATYTGYVVELYLAATLCVAALS